jgi:hypothetical protein
MQQPCGDVGEAWKSPPKEGKEQHHSRPYLPNPETKVKPDAEKK